jgi:hypothetical protein
LHHLRRTHRTGFTDQQVQVFRHDDVADQQKSEARANLAETIL